MSRVLSEDAALVIRLATAIRHEMPAGLEEMPAADLRRALACAIGWLEALVEVVCAHSVHPLSVEKFWQGLALDAAAGAYEEEPGDG